MKRQPERTCIGCRSILAKDEVIRIVAGPSGLLVDYREKLQGRSGYVCPKPECIKTALSKENVSRALRVKVILPTAEEFTGSLIVIIKDRIRSLIAMSAKAGKLAAGYSAVKDALEKKRVEMLLYAEDISEGTKDKVMAQGANVRVARGFTRDELGNILNRELVGIVALEDKGLADAVWKETERLKSLININK